MFLKYYVTIVQPYILFHLKINFSQNEIKFIIVIVAILQMHVVPYKTTLKCFICILNFKLVHNYILMRLK